MADQPKKQRKPRSKKLNLNSKSKWKNILKDVEKKEIPIHVLEKIVIELIDGTKVDIDVKQIISEGESIELLEQRINKKLEELESYIRNVDFFVDIETVEKTIQLETNRILSKL